MAVAVLLIFSALSTIASGEPSGVVPAPVRTINCAVTTLTLQPGLNPPPPKTTSQIAPDIPRHGVSVSLPRYPGATPLMSFVATPFPQYPADPYLQTASAEYHSAENQATVTAWFERVLPTCGWYANGTWTGNGTKFTAGDFWVSARNSSLNVDVSFGSDSSGGTYIGYGVEAITLPARPARSYLHGPFTRLQIALQRSTSSAGQSAPHVIHVAVLDRPVIRQLVAAINRIKEYRAIAPVCFGAVRLTGPAWLSFVRADGTVVHAYEIGPGACGGLAVNGVRWLTDGGQVWKRILVLAGGQG